MQPVLETTYTCGLGGVPVTVRCQHLEQLGALQGLWRQLFILEQQNTTGPCGPICLQFDKSSQSDQPSGEEVYRSEVMQVLRIHTGFYLTYGDSYLTLDLSAQSGTGYLDDAFWELSIYGQREFFLLSLLMLLHQRDRFGIHGNALTLDGRGVLIVAPSGSGKTTLTLSLVQSGWHFLSDDATLLYKNAAGVQALALRRGFSLTEEAFNFFPRLNTPDLPIMYEVQGKQVVDLAALYPEQAVNTCSPDLIIFPTIGRQKTSVLTPVSPSEAVLNLVQQSAGIMTEKQASQRQLNVIASLVEQADCFILTLGSDVYEVPETVSSVLLTV